MKAIIELDVPEWQIGQDVTIIFRDTMTKHGKCELLKEYEAKAQISDAVHETAKQFRQTIVRCKDCIYKEEHPSPYWKYWCNRLECGCDDDWFCADGERR